MQALVTGDLLELILELVLELIFWFQIIFWFQSVGGWFFMLGINFLKIGNGWAIVVKYATTVVYVGTHFFPEFLENSRSHSNAYNNIISSKNLRTNEIRKELMILRKICLVLPMAIRITRSVHKKRTRKWKVKPENYQPVTEYCGSHNRQLYFSLSGLLSSDPDCFKVNEIIFIMIKILMTLGDQSDWCILKNLHL